MSVGLIRNLIDPNARFAFASEDNKPADAVPYDMYEGGFGHRGEDFTFRKEGFGVDEIMRGWARQGLNDHELLARGTQLTEGLYHSLR